MLFIFQISLVFTTKGLLEKNDIINRLDFSKLGEEEIEKELLDKFIFLILLSQIKVTNFLLRRMPK